MRGCLAILLLWALPGAAQDFTTLKGHGGPIMGLAVDAAGGLWSASFDNAVGQWRDQEPRWHDAHDAAVTVVLPIPGAVLSAGDDFILRRWTNGAAEVIGRHKGKIADLAFDPNSELIASASWDGSIGLWGADARFLKGHRGAVTAVAFSPDGLLFSASSDGTLRVWDLTQMTSQVLVHHGFGINRLIVTDNWIAYGAVDGGTRVIDLTGQEIRDFTLDRRPILSMAYHAGSGQLAVGDGQGYIMMVDSAAWRIARDFRATRNGPIWALAFSTDGQTLWAGGLDDVIYGWPVELLDQFDPVQGKTRSFHRDAAQMSNGERQFMRKCSICHALTPGTARKAGPSLHGLFGRRAGTLTDYSYSQTLLGSDIIWDETSVNDLFDQGPDHYIPGSKMPMQVIARQSDRDDLIDFLKIATQE
ncbi:MAG: cytochrome C [Pelagimonas sp.]|jgi:cytochrome c|nr:cytochrome C [Pelagimonas sp.]